MYLPIVLIKSRNNLITRYKGHSYTARDIYNDGHKYYVPVYYSPVVLHITAEEINLHTIVYGVSSSKFDYLSFCLTP